MDNPYIRIQVGTFSIEIGLLRSIERVLMHICLLLFAEDVYLLMHVV
jgi:hypothetical protein